MIQVAKEVCEQDPAIEYIVSSAESIPAQADKIDIATAAGAIQWIDRDLLLANLNHMMRDGGYLLIYDFAISDEMPGSSAYTDWWHNRYLKEFPKPYRNESVWKNEDVIPHGFRIPNQLDLTMSYSFRLESFIEFMMIQSNVNAKIDGEGKNEEKVYQWFLETLSPIFKAQEQSLLFKGYSWYLQHGENR